MRQIKNLFAVTVLVFTSLFTLTGRSEATPYSFSLDHFRAIGDQTGEIVDDFGDNSVDPLWEIYDPTVVESGGSVTFSNPGLIDQIQPGSLNISSEMSYIGSKFQMADGTEDFQGTSKWRPIVPDINQFYGMNIGVGEDIGLMVYNFSPSVADFFGAPQGLGVLFGRFGNSEAGDFDAQGVSIMPDDIVGDIILRLAFDEAAALFTGDFSLNGGATHISPFSGISRIANGPVENVWSLGAESWELHPVPEPSTIILLGGGLVGLIVSRRKLKK